MALSVVHGIMRRRDRHVVLESQHGSGSTFRMHFTPVDRTPISATFAPAKAEPICKGGDQRRLVVVDERDLVDIVEKFLTNPS